MPKTVFMMDDQILLYANMAPPGQHYFYFAREGGEIFLSPRYDIVRFKNTSIYLNRIINKARLDGIIAVQ